MSVGLVQLIEVDISVGVMGNFAVYLERLGGSWDLGYLALDY